jgi:hypothetical protein
MVRIEYQRLTDNSATAEATGFTIQAAVAMDWISLLMSRWQTLRADSEGRPIWMIHLVRADINPVETEPLQ